MRTETTLIRIFSKVIIEKIQMKEAWPGFSGSGAGDHSQQHLDPSPPSACFPLSLCPFTSSVLPLCRPPILFTHTVSSHIEISAHIDTSINVHQTSVLDTPLKKFENCVLPHAFDCVDKDSFSKFKYMQILQCTPYCYATKTSYSSMAI